MGPSWSVRPPYSAKDAVCGNPPNEVVTAKLPFIANELLNSTPNGKNEIAIYFSQLEKLQISILPNVIISSYCSLVNKHTLFPREPDCGYNTVAAFDADVTYLIKLADIA